MKNIETLKELVYGKELTLLCMTGQRISKVNPTKLVVNKYYSFICSGDLIRVFYKKPSWAFRVIDNYTRKVRAERGLGLLPSQQYEDSLTEESFQKDLKLTLSIDAKYYGSKQGQKRIAEREFFFTLKDNLGERWSISVNELRYLLDEGVFSITYRGKVQTRCAEA